MSDKEIDSTVVCSAAELAHEANRLYCQSIGDFSQAAWDQSPLWQIDSAVAGVRAIVAGASPEGLHNSWMRQKVADGWIYGEHKNVELKTHPCMLPYADLPAAQRVKDTLFRDVVTAYLRAVGVLP